MDYDAQNFTLVKKQESAKGIFDFTVKNPQLSQRAKPGQFAHIKVPGKQLRRPISICDADEETIRLVFAIKGEGTEILSDAKVGDTLDIIAPLGHGFTLEEGKRYCFVGGGIGVPPLYFAARQTKAPLVITGFRNKELVILQDDFKSIDGCELILTTDDGSAGVHGFVTDVLKEKINEFDEVCACGPMVMLKAVAELCEKFDKPCQVSLEERMGCGVGACLVCACKTKNKKGEERYSHVCKRGPVFKSKEVVF